jgi:phage protein D
MQAVDLSTYAPEFEIRIDGRIEVGLRNSTTSISINERIGDASQYTMVIADKFDAQKQKFVWLERFLSQDSPLYNPKKKITISIGYAKKLKKIISANLESISTSGFSSDITKLTLTGYDSSHKLLKNMSPGKSKKGINIEKDDTYSDIAKKLADSAGLKKEIDPTTKYRSITIKKNIPYLNFLREAAKRVGYHFFISRDTLYFIDPRKERKPKDQEEYFVFKWNINLQEFVPTINISKLVSEVEVRGHPGDSRELIIEKASTGKEDIIEEDKIEGTQIVKGSQIASKLDIEKRLIVDSNFDTRQEASDIAKAKLNSLGDSLITASCSIVGNPDMCPGQHVIIEGVGKNLSGKYYVTEVTHTIGNGYTTTFHLSKNNIKI